MRPSTQFTSLIENIALLKEGIANAATRKGIASPCDDDVSYIPYETGTKGLTYDVWSFKGEDILVNMWEQVVPELDGAGPLCTPRLL